MTDEGYSLKETVTRVEAKLDALAVVIGAMQLNLASLEPRVRALEKTGDRRWSLVPTWIGTGLAIVLAMAPYLTHI